jgi:DNA-binding transcriptional LysR family regulator
VVVADTSRNLAPQTRGILADQPTLVMPTMQAKIDAQVRGLGCGYLPLTLAAPYLAQGLLAVCETDEGMSLTEHVAYAWRAEPPGEALKWWLQKLKSPRLCESLLGLG